MFCLPLLPDFLLPLSPSSPSLLLVFFKIKISLVCHKVILPPSFDVVHTCAKQHPGQGEEHFHTQKVPLCPFQASPRERSTLVDHGSGFLPCYVGSACWCAPYNWTHTLLHPAFGSIGPILCC